jgi:transcriptional regulator
MDTHLRAIVGLEICITRLEGKFKMSQNRTENDQARVMAELSASDYPPDQAVAVIMRDRLAHVDPGCK